MAKRAPKTYRYDATTILASGVRQQWRGTVTTVSAHDAARQAALQVCQDAVADADESERVVKCSVSVLEIA